jgi:hypothetical protein
MIRKQTHPRRAGGITHVIYTIVVVTSHNEAPLVALKCMLGASKIVKAVLSQLSSRIIVAAQTPTSKQPQA